MKAYLAGAILLSAVLSTQGATGADGDDGTQLQQRSPGTLLGPAELPAFGEADSRDLLSTETDQERAFTSLHSAEPAPLLVSPDVAANVELSRWPDPDRLASVVRPESGGDGGDERAGLLIEASPHASTDAGDAMPRERDRFEAEHSTAATVGAGLLTGIVILLAYLQQRRAARRRFALAVDSARSRSV